MNSYITINERLPVAGRYDVIVVGGGVAGVAAAMASARQGRSTLLIEKSVMLGGLATLGYIVIYLPLCDGNGNRMTSGIAEELLWLSIKNSYNTLPSEWESKPDKIEGRMRYQTLFNGPSLAIQLDRAVTESGADILFDTLFCKTVMDEDKCTHIIVENKDGRLCYECGCIVDATGDASVFQAAGAKTLTGKNYLSYWGYYTTLKGIDTAAESRDITHAVKMFTLGADCNGLGQPADMPVITGDSAADINYFLLRGRQEAEKFQLKAEQEEPGSFAYTGFPGMPQFRTVRMIEGAYALKYGDSGSFFEDSVGCCGDWRNSDIAFELPFGTLYSPTVKNMLAAGRNISNGDSEAWEVTRVIPVAALSGEAAGIAASMYSQGSIADTDIKKLQDKLVAAGGKIHI